MPLLSSRSRSASRLLSLDSSSKGSCRDGELQSLCGKGELDRALYHLENLHSTVPSYTSYLSLLKACAKSKGLSQAKRVQAHLAQHRLQLSRPLGEHLVLTLAKCGALQDAALLLHRLPCRTAFSWTAIISALADSRRGLDALAMHHHMLKDSVEPDAYTFVSLFKACGSIPDLEYGKNLHDQARLKGFTSDVFVCSALVCMYGKCGAIEDAKEVFSGLSEHNVVSWTAMLSAYVDQGQGEMVLLSYRQMVEEGLSPNQGTFVIALQSCGTLAEKQEATVVEQRSTIMLPFEIGQALHADARKKGLASDVFVGTTLISMYGKCGTIVNAENAFNWLCQPNVPLWNSMLSAYVETGQGEKALQLYVRMLGERLSPDQQTYVIALQACGILAEKEEAKIVDGIFTKALALEIGQALHADARKKSFASDVFVGTTLVSMYGKCGAIVEAENVFNGLSNRNIVSWNAMLSAYAEQGEAEKATELYRQMLKEGVSLDDVTFVCVLQGCSETGSIDICRQLHFTIVCIAYNLSLLLTCTIIHGYGSCANMEDAHAVFHALPNPDVVSWNACIAGYAGEGNCAASLQMFEEMQLAGFKPDGVTFTSLLSSCSHAGLVHEAVEYFEIISTYYHVPTELTHHVSMIDLIGRAGDFKRLDGVLGRMQVQDDLAIWLCLLGACRTHGNVELGKQVFLRAINLQPKDTAAYVLMSNIYADAGLQDCTNQMVQAGRCTNKALLEPD